MDNNSMKRENILVRTLGSNVFNNIRDFFQAIEYGDSDYNIYISKKCYTLFLVFEPFLKLADNKIRCTDIRIPLLEDNIRGKKVTIIDDILIHGRTLTKIKRKLLELECQIEVCVFAKNEEASTVIVRETSEAVEVNLKELRETATSAKQFYSCNRYLWRKLSDLIMRSFWVTNTPYSGYLPVVEIGKRGLCVIEGEKTLYNKYTCDNHSTSKMGLTIEYLFPRGEWANDLVQSGSYFCASLQKNEKINSYKMLPILILDDRIYNDKEVICSIYKKLYGNKYSQIYSMLHLEKYGVDEDVSITNIKFLIYSLSRRLLETFLCELCVKTEYYHFDNRNLEFSFGKEFLQLYKETPAVEQSLIRLSNFFTTKENIIKKRVLYINDILCLRRFINNRLNSKKPDFLSENSEKAEPALLNGLYKSINNVETLYKDYNQYSNAKKAAYMFARFFKYNSELDEEELYQSKNRLLGLNIWDVLQVTSEKANLNYEEVLAGFFCQYYLGASTVVASNTKKGYGLYCHAGEQSYKCIIHEFVPLVYFDYRYRNNFVQEVADKMNECFRRLAVENYKYFDVPFSLEDYMTYSRGYYENIYDIQSLQEHCKEDSSRILCRVGFMLEDYVSRTNNVKEMSGEELMGVFRSYINENSEKMSISDKKYIMEAFNIV